MTDNYECPTDLSMRCLSNLISHYLPQLTLSTLSLFLLEPNKHTPVFGPLHWLSPFQFKWDI